LRVTVNSLMRCWLLGADYFCTDRLISPKRVPETSELSLEICLPYVANCLLISSLSKLIFTTSFVTCDWSTSQKCFVASLCFVCAFSLWFISFCLLSCSCRKLFRGWCSLKLGASLLGLRNDCFELVTFNASA